jgi:predicted HicB family RNase H-like nuclease
MAKKSFRGSNPALQYISAMENESQNTQPTDNTQNTPKVYPTHETQVESDTQDASSIQNAQDDSNMDNTSNTQNTHIIQKTHKRETKSKRLNLLLQPSLLDDMSKIACMKQTSVNDLINKVLRDYTQSEVSTMARYDEVFGSKSAEMA